MADHTPDLVDRLASSEETGLDPALLVPLLKLLANGEPVAVDELAAATGRTVEEIRKGLAAVPDTEYDADGRIVGQGLTREADATRRISTITALRLGDAVRHGVSFDAAWWAATESTDDEGGRSRLAATPFGVCETRQIT